MALFLDSWSIHTVPWLSSSMYSTHSLPAMTAQSLLFLPSLPSSSTLRIKITSTVVKGYQGTGREMSGQKGFVPLGTGRESSLPLATLHFLNCLAAQACSYGGRRGGERAKLFSESVTASCDRATETARCWTLAPANMDYVKGWPQDWCGYANASQMGGVWAGWTAGDSPPPRYGRQNTVWQVHHSVIKGHIITYNQACMTIGRINTIPLRAALCVSFNASLAFPAAFFFFVFARLQIWSVVLETTLKICSYVLLPSLKIWFYLLKISLEMWSENNSENLMCWKLLWKYDLMCWNLPWKYDYMFWNLPQKCVLKNTVKIWSCML